MGVHSNDDWKNITTSKKTRESCKKFIEDEKCKKISKHFKQKTLKTILYQWGQKNDDRKKLKTESQKIQK